MCLTMLRCLPPTTLGDATALDAARRLKMLLPSRKHVAFDEEPRTGMGYKRPVMVAGTVYESIRQAANAHKVAPSRVHKWLEEGKAYYADD